MDRRLYEEFLQVSARCIEQMVADRFDDTKKAYKAFGMSFEPASVEEYKKWLTEKYPIPTIESIW